METTILYLFIAVLCLLSLLVTVKVLVRDDLESFQKIAQIVIVWLFPLIGAVGIWAFHRSNDAPLKPQKSSGSTASDSGFVSSGTGGSSSGSD